MSVPDPFKATQFACIWKLGKNAIPEMIYNLYVGTRIPRRCYPSQTIAWKAVFLCDKEDAFFQTVFEDAGLLRPVTPRGVYVSEPCKIEKHEAQTNFLRAYEIQIAKPTILDAVIERIYPQVHFIYVLNEQSTQKQMLDLTVLALRDELKAVEVREDVTIIPVKRYTLEEVKKLVAS